MLCLIISAYLYFNSLEIEVNNKKELKKLYNKIDTLILNDSSKTKMKKVLKVDLDNEMIITGQDAYYNKKPNQKIIKKYKLEKYVAKQKELVNNLENKIKENYETKVSKTENMGNYISIKIDYKNFYYYNYLTDLKIAQKNILNIYNLKGKINNYKAKVKVMQIMDNYLDEYSSNETDTFECVFLKGKVSKNKDNILAYFNNINGSTYKNLEANSEARVDTYMTNINTKNPLKL